jgi:hypothetical protein
MRRSALVGVLPLLAFAAVFTPSKKAHAEPVISIDLDLGTAFRRQVDFSYGLGGRFGYKFHFPLTSFFLQPEVGGHYMSFGSDNALGYYDHAGTVNGGLRLGFGHIVQPFGFAHLGLGFVGDSRLGPAADIGGGLDFQITRVFSLGAQAAYNSVSITDYGDAAKWVSFGLNFGFHIPSSTRGSRRR